MGTGLKGMEAMGGDTCRDLGGKIRARALALGHGSLDPHDLLISGLAGAMDELLLRDLDCRRPSPALEIMLELLQSRSHDAQLSKDLAGLQRTLRSFGGMQRLQPAS